MSVQQQLLGGSKPQPTFKSHGLVAEGVGMLAMNAAGGNAVGVWVRAGNAVPEARKKNKPKQ